MWLGPRFPTSTIRTYELGERVVEAINEENHISAWVREDAVIKKAIQAGPNATDLFADFLLRFASGDSYAQVERSHGSAEESHTAQGTGD